VDSVLKYCDRGGLATASKKARPPASEPTMPMDKMVTPLDFCTVAALIAEELSEDWPLGSRLGMVGTPSVMISMMRLREGLEYKSNCSPARLMAPVVSVYPFCPIILALLMHCSSQVLSHVSGHITAELLAKAITPIRLPDPSVKVALETREII
jgi:hypothetical protein